MSQNISGLMLTENDTENRKSNDGNMTPVLLTNKIDKKAFAQSVENSNELVVIMNSSEKSADFKKLGKRNFEGQNGNLSELGAEDFKASSPNKSTGRKITISTDQVPLNNERFVFKMEITKRSLDSNKGDLRRKSMETYQITEKTQEDERVETKEEKEDFRVYRMEINRRSSARNSPRNPEEAEKLRKSLEKRVKLQKEQEIAKLKHKQDLEREIAAKESVRKAQESFKKTIEKDKTISIDSNKKKTLDKEKINDRYGDQIVTRVEIQKKTIESKPPSKAPQEINFTFSEAENRKTKEVINNHN